MGRLTKRDNRTKSGCRLPTYATKNEENVFIKLFELENLEDSLGIDLITLFKALKDGIEVGNDKMRVCLKNCKLTYKKEDNEYAFIYDYYLVKLKDYKKTWWLKEELEDVNTKI